MHSARFLLSVTLSIGFVSAQTCDRACLKTTLDQYLNGVVKHDPKAAPLFAGFRQTDNGVVVRPGTGTWQSITSLGKVQRSYFDPVSGQAAYLGSIEEDERYQSICRPSGFFTALLARQDGGLGQTRS